MKKIQKHLGATLIIVGIMAAIFMPLTTYAASKCGGVDTALISCSEGGDNGGGFWGILNIVINIMTAGIGIVAIGGIVYGAILYSSAGDKSAQIEQAKTIITNVIIGLVAYALMYAFLQFLIPGGVFA